MIRFKFFKEDILDNTYVLSLNFKDREDFFKWCNENNNFELFLESIKEGLYSWCDINYITSGIDNEGIEYVGFKSYDIKDFQLAFQNSEQFFNLKNILI